MNKIVIPFPQLDFGRDLTVVNAFLLIGSALASEPAPSVPAVMQEYTTNHDVRMRWWREARFGIFVHWGGSVPRLHLEGAEDPVAQVSKPGAGPLSSTKEANGALLVRHMIYEFNDDATVVTLDLKGPHKTYLKPISAKAKQARFFRMDNGHPHIGPNMRVSFLRAILPLQNPRP